MSGISSNISTILSAEDLDIVTITSTNDSIMRLYRICNVYVNIVISSPVESSTIFEFTII